MTDSYRLAASMMLLRPTEEGYEFLLLHKPRKRDAWQLPQGGVEAGESLVECAVRELQEEAGIAGVRVLGTSNIIYQYDFPASYRRFRPDSICGQKIGFVHALASANVQVTVDAIEVDKYKWITPRQIGAFIRRQEYTALVRALYQEALQCVTGTIQ